VRGRFAVLVAVGLLGSIASPAQTVGASPLKPPASQATTSAGPKAVTAAGAWKWQHPLPDGQPLFAVSCPSVSTCYVAGTKTQILKTVDGGATWARQSLAAGIASFSCASVSVCVGVGVQGTAINTSNGGTNWTSQTINAGQQLSTVSCPTTAVCVAAGTNGSILTTSNGGVSWAVQPNPPGGVLQGISCPTSTDCFVVGNSGAIFRSANGGATWTPISSGTANYLNSVSCNADLGVFKCMAVGQAGFSYAFTVGGTVPGPGAGSTGSGRDLNGVSCPTASLCFATGQDGGVYILSGNKWGRTSTQASGRLFGISCPSLTACLAVGDYGIVVSTANGGTGWTPQSPAGAGDLSAVSCPTTTTCFAVEATTGGIYRTTNGQLWVKVFTATGVALSAVSCPSAAVCFVTGKQGSIYSTADGGQNWTSKALARQFTGISCPTAAACIAVDAQGLQTRTVDGGATWGPSGQVVTSTYLNGVNCPSATVCFAIQGGLPSYVYKTADFGNNWTLSFNIATDPQAGVAGGFSAISCPNTNTCYVPAGSNGISAVALTTDGGTNWRTSDVNSSAWLRGISCPSAGTCYAAANDSTILYSSDYGATWSALFGNVVAPYAAVSCPTTTACFVVGDGGVITATTTGALAWAKLQPTQSTNSIFAISCPDASNCAAAAWNTLLATHDAGATWSERTLINGDQMQGVSCPTASTCVAVGWPGAVYRTTDGGVNWTAQSNPLSGADETLEAVTCMSPTSCMAVGTSGKGLVTSDGATWTARNSPTTQTLFGLFCITIDSCVAVGANGTAVTYNTGIWATSGTGVTEKLGGVSCQTSGTGICYAVGNAGTLLFSWNAGRSWQPRTSGVTSGLMAIDCIPSGICVAAGTSGAVIYSDDGQTWSAFRAPVVYTLRGVTVMNSGQVWVVGNGGTILQNPSMFAPGLPAVTRLSPDVGPTAGGTSVTMTGAGFSNSMSSVKFGGVSAGGFSVMNDRTANIVSPAHAAGCVDVNVTTRAGTSATTPADQFAYAPGTYLPSVAAVNPNSVPWLGQVDVIIYGCGFTGATAVKFGATLAQSFTVVSDHQINALSPTRNQAPADVFVVDVTVTTPSGTSPITPADRFTYSCSPTVTSVSPNAGPISGGTSVTINGCGGFTTTNAVKFGTTPAPRFTVVSDTQVIAVSPPHAPGPVDVYVTWSSPGGVGSTGTNWPYDQFTYGSSGSWYFPWFDLASTGMYNDNIHLLNISGVTATVTVSLQGASPITVTIFDGDEKYVSFGRKIGGPVVVSSDQLILASQRVQYYNSFNEVWGMSPAQAATTSYINWYDKASPGMFNDNIHLINPGATTANVTVSMPGASNLSVAVAGGAGTYVTFPAGTIGGPVKITSDLPVLASQRVQYYQTFNEVVARSPYEASTQSYFNWFDKASTGMVNDNIHILNTSATTAIGSVSLPGAADLPFSLAAGEGTYVSFPAGTIGGPVTVSASQPVLATQRVQYYQSFNEVPQATAQQAGKVSHLMWFDTASAGMNGDNIHVLNTSAVTAIVVVRLRGAADIRFSLAAGAETYVAFPPGSIGGPVTISSDQNVVAAQRVQYFQTFNEVAAMLRTTSYSPCPPWVVSCTIYP